MLSSAFFLPLLAVLASAAPTPGGGEGPGVDVVKQSNYKEHELAAKISLKEICYRNLYADVSKGQNVFLFDGIKKDVNDKEFYYEEFCYKQFNVKQHNENGPAPPTEQKANTAVLGGGGGLGHGIGGKGYVKRDGFGGG
ncbi:hypothetical protein RHOSPDRAFT_27676, partial [Rhodotorula sp. JG-1b]